MLRPGQGRLFALFLGSNSLWTATARHTRLGKLREVLCCRQTLMFQSGEKLNRCEASEDYPFSTRFTWAHFWARRYCPSNQTSTSSAPLVSLKRPPSPSSDSASLFEARLYACSGLLFFGGKEVVGMRVFPFLPLLFLDRLPCRPGALGFLHLFRPSSCWVLVFSRSTQSMQLASLPSFHRTGPSHSPLWGLLESRFLLWSLNPGLSPAKWSRTENCCGRNSRHFRKCWKAPSHELACHWCSSLPYPFSSDNSSSRLSRRPRSGCASYCCLRLPPPGMCVHLPLFPFGPYQSLRLGHLHGAFVVSPACWQIWTCR